EKYNGPGHVRWAGRMYGPGLTRVLGWRRPRIYHGIWGRAPFQSLYEPAPSLVAFLPQMPEWHLMTATLGAMAGLSVVWSPLLLLERLLRAQHACVLCGDEHDGWDLEVRGGILGAARLLVGVEDHAGGKQLLRLRWWPKVPARGPLLALGLGALTFAAMQSHAWVPAVLLGLGALLPPLHIVEQCM